MRVGVLKIFFGARGGGGGSETAETRWPQTEQRRRNKLRTTFDEPTNKSNKSKQQSKTTVPTHEEGCAV